MSNLKDFSKNMEYILWMSVGVATIVEVTVAFNVKTFCELVLLGEINRAFGDNINNY
jgi:hypothetical protein